MTVINRMIRQIKKENAQEVFLRRCDVRTLAEHVRMSTRAAKDSSIDELEKMICDGQLKMLGVKVTVK